MRIVYPRDLKKRSYISFYLEGKRMREYNGNCLRLPIFPNRTNNPTDKSRMLLRLRFELLKAIKEGNYRVVFNTPIQKEKSKAKSKSSYPTAYWLDKALARKEKSALSYTIT